MFSLLENVSLVEIQHAASFGDFLAGSIQQNDGSQLARLDQLIGAAIYQFGEQRLQPLLQDGPTKLHAADASTNSIGNVFGAVAQLGLGRSSEPEMLLSLPGYD
jgi:hypothetical protein